MWISLSYAGAVDAPLNTYHSGDLIDHAVRAVGARTAIMPAELVDRIADVAGALPLDRLAVSAG